MLSVTQSCTCELCLNSLFFGPKLGTGYCAGPHAVCEYLTIDIFGRVAGASSPLTHSSHWYQVTRSSTVCLVVCVCVCVCVCVVCVCVWQEVLIHRGFVVILFWLRVSSPGVSWCSNHMHAPWEMHVLWSME